VASDPGAYDTLEGIRHAAAIEPPIAAEPIVATPAEIERQDEGASGQPNERPAPVVRRSVERARASRRRRRARVTSEAGAEREAGA